MHERNLEHSLEQQARALLRHKSGSADAIFLTRALRVFEALLRDLSKDALSSAAAAPSDAEAVFRAMLGARKALLDPVRERDPLALARIRGQQARAALLSEEGGTLSASNVAELLGISRQAVNKRRQGGRLLALPLGRHGFAYPAWQFSGGDLIPGLVDVLGELAGHDPWMQARFFLNPNERLGGSPPLAELRRGRVEPVREAARAHGEHGAA